MTCKRTDLGGGFSVTSCSRRGPAEPEPLCEACRAKPATLCCQFALRGAKAGQVCGTRLCSRCSVEAIDWPKVRAGPMLGEPLAASDRRVTSIRVCRPHAALLKRMAAR